MAKSVRVYIRCTSDITIIVNTTVEDVFAQINYESSKPFPFITVYKTEYSANHDTAEWGWNEETVPTYINVNHIISVSNNKI
tara:strand:+ start:193 stop:438 length:246 start_codon:yes stop_codon:yes gene_type:complete